MSIKSFNSLEITGSFLEVPPAKEPTRALDKKVLNPIDLNAKRRNTSLLQVSRSLTNRSLSQLSNHSSIKSIKQAPVSTPNNDQQIRNYEVIKKIKH